MPEFYLVSTELRESYEPRACRIVRRLASELRDDLALVKVEPPIPRHVYETEEDLEWLILGSRHQGASLFPITEWPSAVYICRLSENSMPRSETITSENLRILDFGEVRGKIIGDSNHLLHSPPVMADAGWVNFEVPLHP